jgi:hypothetical protein
MFGWTLKLFGCSIALLLVACDPSPPAISQSASVPLPETTLHEAIEKDRFADVRSLANAGADLDERQDDFTPLHRAILRGRQDSALLLIEKGADVDARDNDGRTPLHHAVAQNQTDVAEALLAKGADVEAVDNNGMTVLGAAGYSGEDAGSPEIEAGMVVSIDTENQGELTLSTEAYDRKAVGIISGAGDLKPGMYLGKSGDTATAGHPIALSGRVYCWTDATLAPVEVGDLLTTSNTPGHAMKAIDFGRAQGSIVGKAMSPLAEGKGLVLVFVTLQ